MSQQSQLMIFHIYTSETGKNALHAAREMKDARYSVDISEESLTPLPRWASGSTC